MLRVTISQGCRKNEFSQTAIATQQARLTTRRGTYPLGRSRRTIRRTTS